MVLFGRQTNYLDRLVVDSREKTRLPLTRAALATIEAAELTVTDGTGPALALATPLTRIDLKPGR